MLSTDDGIYGSRYLRVMVSTVSVRDRMRNTAAHQNGIQLHIKMMNNGLLTEQSAHLNGKQPHTRMENSRTPEWNTAADQNGIQPQTIMVKTGIQPHTRMVKTGIHPHSRMFIDCTMRDRMRNTTSHPNDEDLFID
ncbi:hypothetical protein DPMN_091561 [Dreissena polymorpha]|uniref:Uncharacterized protein n=1 Tax=Dreissena polymorpha TaxID=45954 RepID=A0A9D4R0U2_DREPO|nr:hypothetical protein DPMN_091561 [Dreissena polymorpha]